MDEEINNYNKNIYPDLNESDKDFINKDFINKDFINKDFINKDLNKEITIQELKTKLSNLRIVDFESDLNYLDEKIKHYNKIYKRWKQFDSGIRYTDIFIGTCLGITSVTILSLISFGFIIPVLITSVITSIPLGYSILHGILSKGLIKSRKKKYHELIIKITEVRNKLFLFHQKALDDDILTDEEISISKNMVKGIKDMIKNINIKEEKEDQDLLKEIEALKEKVKNTHKK